eukprot:1161603-Pelagomonas_calceolata.AAC.1
MARGVPSPQPSMLDEAPEPSEGKRDGVGCAINAWNFAHYQRRKENLHDWLGISRTRRGLPCCFHASGIKSRSQDQYQGAEWTYLPCPCILCPARTLLSFRLELSYPQRA